MSLLFVNLSFMVYDISGASPKISYSDAGRNTAARIVMSGQSRASLFILRRDGQIARSTG